MYSSALTRCFLSLFYADLLLAIILLVDSIFFWTDSIFYVSYVRRLRVHKKHWFEWLFGFTYVKWVFSHTSTCRLPVLDFLIENAVHPFSISRSNDLSSCHIFFHVFKILYLPSPLDIYTSSRKNRYENYAYIWVINTANTWSTSEYIFVVGHKSQVQFWHVGLQSDTVLGSSYRGRSTDGMLWLCVGTRKVWTSLTFFVKRLQPNWTY